MPSPCFFPRRSVCTQGTLYRDILVQLWIIVIETRVERFFELDGIPLEDHSPRRDVPPIFHFRRVWREWFRDDFSVVFANVAATSKLNCVRRQYRFFIVHVPASFPTMKFRFDWRSEEDAEEIRMKIYCFAWHAILYLIRELFLRHGAWYRVKLYHNP